MHANHWKHLCFFIHVHCFVSKMPFRQIPIRAMCIVLSDYDFATGMGMSGQNMNFHCMRERVRFCVFSFALCAQSMNTGVSHAVQTSLNEALFKVWTFNLSNPIRQILMWQIHLTFWFIIIRYKREVIARLWIDMNIWNWVCWNYRTYWWKMRAIDKRVL